MNGRLAFLLVPGMVSLAGNLRGEPRPVEASELTVGAAVHSRSLEYWDDRFDTMYGHRVDRAFSWRTSVRLFPGALLKDRGYSFVGLGGSYDLGFTGKSRLGEKALGSSSGSALAEVLFRFPVDDHAVLLRLGYGKQYYSVERSGVGRPPDVDYSFIRLGVEATFRFERFWLAAGVGLRPMTGFGEIGEAPWFPKTRGLGQDATLQIGYSLTEYLGLVGAAEYRRYALDLRPDPREARAAANQVAGGVVDSYPAGWLGLRWYPAGGGL